MIEYNERVDERCLFVYILILMLVAETSSRCSWSASEVHINLGIQFCSNFKTCEILAVGGLRKSLCRNIRPCAAIVCDDGFEKIHVTINKIAALCTVLCVGIIIKFIRLWHHIHPLRGLCMTHRWPVECK